MDDSGQLTIHQQLNTKGCVDLAWWQTTTDTYLIIANQRDNSGDKEQGVELYSWNSLTQLFGLLQRLESSNVQNVATFSLDASTRCMLLFSVITITCFGKLSEKLTHSSENVVEQWTNQNSYRD